MDTKTDSLPDQKTETVEYIPESELVEYIPESELVTEDEFQSIFSRYTRQTIKQAFQGNDSLGFINDPDLKGYLGFLTDRIPDGDEYRKRMALAAYFTSKTPGVNYQFVLGNLDAILEQFYGKKTNASAAYADLSSLLSPKSLKQGWLKPVARGGTAQLMGTLANLGWTMLEGAAQFGNAQTDIAGMKERAASIHSDIRKFRDESVGYWNDVSEEERLKILPSDWASVEGAKKYGVSGTAKHAVLAILFEAPGMTAQAGLGFVNPALVPLAMGVTSANDKMYSLDTEHPEMKDGWKVLNALSTGLINGYLEKVTMGIMKGKGLNLEPQTLKAGFREGLKYYFKSSMKEGGEEVAEQLGENLTDLLTGVYGPVKDMNPDDVRDYLMQGLPESFIIGGAYGGIFAAMGHKNHRAAEEKRLGAVNALEGEKQRLLAVENPTEQETEDLKNINQILEAGDYRQISETAGQIALRNTMEKSRNMQETVDADAERTIDDDAEIAKQNYLLRMNQLAHNPQDTAEALFEMAKIFRNIRIEAADGPAAFSPEALAEAKRRNADPEFIRAWYVESDNAVWVNTRRVRPSEVPFLMLHEIATHKGLPEVLGKNYGPVMDSIFQQYREYIEEVNQIYHFDLDTVDGRQMATEEYLADRAEFCGHDWRAYEQEHREDVDRYILEHGLSRESRKNAVHALMEADGLLNLRPSWWREFLQKIKMFLRSWKGFEEYRFSDREIETLLLRGLRKTGNKSVINFYSNRRNGNRAHQASSGSVTDSGIETAQNPETVNFVPDADSQDGDLRFAMDQNGTPMFYVSGKGLMNAQSILEDKTIPEDTLILTDSQRENWGHISEDMIRNAPPDLALKSLPIRLYKGNGAYGLVHLFKHLKDFGRTDLSHLIENVFGKPNKIYARKDGDKIKLEVFPKPPDQWGILELREEKNCYSVISFYPRQNSHSKAKGKLIWEYGSHSVSSQAASELPNPGISEKTPQDIRAELATKSYTIINPFGIKSSTITEKNHNTSGTDAGSGNVKSGTVADSQDGDLRFAALRRKGAPNHAMEKGKIVVGDFPHASGFMEWAGLEGKGLYADAEMLMGRHHEYFEDQIHALAAAAFVLSAPEKAHDMNNNLAFVRKDEESGKYFRLEISKKVSGKRNQIRSVHELQKQQYEKAKAGIDFPVLQPSSTGSGKGVQLTRNYSDFIRYYTVKYPNVKFSIPSVYSGSDADSQGASEPIGYSLETAIASKAGYRVERVNENAGREFNEAKGVIVQPEQIYRHGEVPKEQPRTWLRKRCVEYAQTNHILGEHETPALGNGVKVTVGSIKAVLNHPGSDIKNNLIAAIPDMLRNAVLIQVEDNGRNKAYLLASKVRYGENDRFIVGMIIHESQGKFYYDHELVEIENADIQNGLPLSTLGTGSESASVITVIQNALFASGFDKKDVKNIKFSLEQYSDAERGDIVTFLKPYVGRAMERSDADYLKHLRKNGFNVASEEDAHVFASEAQNANERDARERGFQIREAWLREEGYPLYGKLIELTGQTNFKIKPSYRFSGEEFTGSFIAEQWRKKKTPKKEKIGLSAVAEDYKNEVRMKKAKGYWSDELARMIADKYGGDANSIEQEIIDTFRDLNRNVMFHTYKKFRESRLLLERREIDALRAEYEAREDRLAEDEAARILKDGTALTDSYIAANQRVFRILYRMVYNREAPRKYSTVNLAAMNAAIESKRPELNVLAQGFRQGREEAFRKYMRKISELKETILNDRNSVIEIQRKVMRFAAENLPKENRSEFAGRVISLLKYSNTPSKKNPLGRRRVEVDRLFVEITERGRELQKEKTISRMREMLASAKTRTNYRGIRVSILPEVQATVDRIREIINMDIATVNRMISLNNDIIYQAERSAEESQEERRIDLEAAAEEKYRDNQLLTKYGNLSMKTAEQVEEAGKELLEMIRNGKGNFLQRLEQRKNRVQEMRDRSIRETNSGKKIPERKKEENRWYSYLNQFGLDHTPLTDMLRLMGVNAKENSLAEEFSDRVFDATQKQETGLNRMQSDLDQALREKCSIDSLLKKGAFYKMIVKEVEHTGVKISRFYTEYKDSSGSAYLRPGRPARRRWISAEHCRALLEDVSNGFHVKNHVGLESENGIDLEFYDEVRDMLKKNGLKTKRFFDLFEGINENGMHVLRAYTHQMDGGEIQRIEIPFRNSYLEFQKENFRPVTPAALVFLRQQLIDFDHGIKATYSLFGNAEDDAMNEELGKERSQKKICLFTDSPSMRVEDTELALTPAAALQILLTWEQDHYKPNMEWNGWTETNIEQLKTFLKRFPGVMEMGYWMRDYIKKNKKELDNLVFKRYGCHLPENDRYFPATFAESKSDVIESGLGRGEGARTVSAGFLTERKFHLKPVDTQGNAFSVFMGNQLEQNHFIAFSDVVRDLLSVYNDRWVQNVISDRFGFDFWRNLRHRIGLLASDGERASKAAQFINTFFRYWVPARIAINSSSGLKQIAGVVSYMNKVPIEYFMKKMPTANFMNPDFRKFVRWAVETPYYKNRMAGGMNREYLYLMNYTRNSRNYNPLADWLLSAGTWITRKTDSWSTLHGGYVAYCYYRDQAIRHNRELKMRKLRKETKMALSDEVPERKKNESLAAGENPVPEAEESLINVQEYAYRKWGEATDETQQSGYMKDLNAFQAGQGAVRFATVFLSNPIRTMSLEATAMRELYYAESKKTAAKKLCRIMFTNHVAVPILMHTISNLFAHGVEWDEWEIQDYLIGMLMGSYEGLFLFGTFLTQFGNVVYDTALRNKSFGQATISAVPLFDDVITDVKLAGKIIRSDEAWDGQDFMSSIKILGDALMLGPGNSYTKTSGALLTALGTQGRRVLRWFKEEER